MPYCYDMCIVCEDFVRDRINVLVRIVLRKIEFDQIGLLEGFAIDRVGIVLDEPSYNVLVVEYESFCCAYWSGERL